MKLSFRKDIEFKVTHLQVPDRVELTQQPFETYRAFQFLFYVKRMLYFKIQNEFEFLDLNLIKQAGNFLLSPFGTSADRYMPVETASVSHSNRSTISSLLGFEHLQTNSNRTEWSWLTSVKCKVCNVWKSDYITARKRQSHYWLATSQNERQIVNSKRFWISRSNKTTGFRCRAGLATWKIAWDRGPLSFALNEFKFESQTDSNQSDLRLNRLSAPALFAHNQWYPEKLIKLANYEIRKSRRQIKAT